jgi:hypothetical protein
MVTLSVIEQTEFRISARVFISRDELLHSLNKHKKQTNYSKQKVKVHLRDSKSVFKANWPFAAAAERGRRNRNTFYRRRQKIKANVFYQGSKRLANYLPFSVG